MERIMLAKLEHQCKWLIELKQYNLGLNVCDLFIRRKYKKSVTKTEYEMIQREGGYHLFVLDKNHKKPKNIFKLQDNSPSLYNSSYIYHDITNTRIKYT